MSHCLQIYVDYVIRNPLYEPGDVITSELFENKLDEYIRNLPIFASKISQSRDYLRVCHLVCITGLQCDQTRIRNSVPLFLVRKYIGFYIVCAAIDLRQLLPLCQQGFSLNNPQIIKRFLFGCGTCRQKMTSQRQNSSQRKTAATSHTS